MPVTESFATVGSVVVNGTRSRSKNFPTGCPASSTTMLLSVSSGVLP